jgi:protein-disulfide isomerase
MATKRTAVKAESKKSPRVSMPVEDREEYMERAERPVRVSTSENAYSLSSMLQFLNNNFLLLVCGLGLFVFGFVFGSLWQENKTLKAGGVGVGTQQAAPQAAPPEAGPLSDADWAEILKDPVITIGDKNAPVTMVEFTDYQCPFCEQYFSQTHSQIVDEYVKSGKVKIVLRDQPLSFHPNANSAAQLVRCAVEQNKGLEMHDELFTNQAIWSPLSGDALFAKYTELANAAGLDGAKAIACVKSDKYRKAADADSALGVKVGAGGTPTFFIEKDPLVGAQPFAVFQAKIDEKLAAK